MLDKIKSLYILSKVVKHLPKKIYLNIFKYNKFYQKKFNISNDSYKRYYNEIEIELIPDKNELMLIDDIDEFIHIAEKEDKSFYHIYFDDSKEEMKRNYIKKDENISKIKVVIDMEVKTIAKLFSECSCLKEIKFIRFNRIDFLDYKNMFESCSNLINLDVSQLKTDEVRNMDYMFYNCSSLRHLNLSNFKTVHVESMNHMFEGCSSLKEINLSNSKIDNVKTMIKMFNECSSLKKLNISNFKFNKLIDVEFMFRKCPEKLKNKIREKFKEIFHDAFNDYNDSSLISFIDDINESDNSSILSY